jgi:hypothetical protein
LPRLRSLTLEVGMEGMAGPPSLIQAESGNEVKIDRKDCLNSAKKLEGCSKGVNIFTDGFFSQLILTFYVIKVIEYIRLRSN